MFDFLVKNASLPDGTEGIDIAGKNGLITAVEKNISAEAKEVIEDYFSQFHVLKTWLDRSKQFIQDNGFIYSYFGRKRRLPNVFSEDKGIAAHEVRSGINFLVQSIASDVNLLGAIDSH